MTLDGSRIGADVLVELLLGRGISVIPTLSGNQIMPLYGRIEAAGIRLIHARHEAAAIHIADAIARLTDSVSVALLTAGPGHANAMGAIYSARMAQSPVVTLSGHAERSRLGYGAFQEMDQTGMAAWVCQGSWTVGAPERLGADFARAWRSAMSPVPGPTHLSLPADILTAPIPSERRSSSLRFTTRCRAPNGVEVERVLALLHGAKRPLIAAGPAWVRGAKAAALAAFTEITGCSALALESPRGVNDPSLGRLAGIVAQADVIVALGRRFDVGLGFGRPPAVAASCVLATAGRFDESRPDRPIAASIDGEPASILDALTIAARNLSWPDWLGWRRDIATETAVMPDMPSRSPHAIHPGRLADIVGRAIGERDILVVDGGEFGQWAQAVVRRRERVINGPSGAIGGAVPFAIGARIARPDTRVFAFTGDGALGYHLAEFETAARNRLPFVCIVGNDRRWNAEVVIQRRLGGPSLPSLDLDPARYDLATAALGGHGERVEDECDLGPAIERAIASGKPALIDVAIEGLAAPAYNRRGGSHV
ncbi:MAG: thiamine pyrophosphate-binding protein [Chloroflexota bacterium]|nr:MAG: thiamine pyrophosphate-binding protein [Chloroflexota bacterium]